MSKKIFVGVLLVLASLTARAQEESRMPFPELPSRSELHLYLLDPEMRYERDTNLEWVDRKPTNFAFAYRAENVSLLMEYARFEDDSGNAASNFERTHQELIAWGRWHFFQREFGKWNGSMYGGLGVGAYQEQVKTTLNGQSQTDSTDAKIMTGASLGLDISYLFTHRFGMVVALEGRALVASDFDPNPTWSGVLRVGFVIPLN